MLLLSEDMQITDLGDYLAFSAWTYTSHATEVHIYPKSNCTQVR